MPADTLKKPLNAMQLAPHLMNPVAGAAKLRDMLLDQLVQKAVLEGQSGYVKFVVLGWYRSGSNFLITSLNSHPHAVVFSELFPPKRSFGPTPCTAKGRGRLP